jgi:hypothetical protein
MPARQHRRGTGHRSDHATLDASGNGTVYLAPEVHWDEWEVTRVVVKTSQPTGTVPVPTAEVYLNDPVPFDNHHGGTRDGDLDVAQGSILLHAGDQLLVVFTGGRPGDIAMASAHGPYQVDTQLPGA